MRLNNDVPFATEIDSTRCVCRVIFVLSSAPLHINIYFCLFIKQQSKKTCFFLFLQLCVGAKRMHVTKQREMSERDLIQSADKVTSLTLHMATNETHSETLKQKADYYRSVSLSWFPIYIYLYNLIHRITRAHHFYSASDKVTPALEI